VDDPVRDRFEGSGRVVQRLERPALFGCVDERELQARRAGVDYENA
jgi:hypothetical protein